MNLSSPLLPSSHSSGAKCITLVRFSARLLRPELMQARCRRQSILGKTVWHIAHNEGWLAKSNSGKLDNEVRMIECVSV